MTQPTTAHASKGPDWGAADMTAPQSGGEKGITMSLKFRIRLVYTAIEFMFITVSTVFFGFVFFCLLVMAFIAVLPSVAHVFAPFAPVTRTELVPEVRVSKPAPTPAPTQSFTPWSKDNPGANPGPAN